MKPKGYSFTQIALHWVIFALILFQVIGHEPMAEAWDAIEEGATPEVGWMVQAHAISGVVVLLLVLWRLVLRWQRGVPDAPEGEAEILRKAAHWGHLALYGLMVVVPLSGMAAWWGGVIAAAELHEMMKTALIVLVIVHVLAALWHQFWLKDNLLARMKRPE